MYKTTHIYTFDTNALKYASLMRLFIYNHLFLGMDRRSHPNILLIWFGLRNVSGSRQL